MNNDEPKPTSEHLVDPRCKVTIDSLYAKPAAPEPAEAPKCAFGTPDCFAGREGVTPISVTCETRGGQRFVRSPVKQEAKPADAASAFKTYVHERLDAMGVPTHFPDGEHTKAGCRIGDRLDWVQARIAPAEDSPIEGLRACIEAALDELPSDIGNEETRLQLEEAQKIIDRLPILTCDGESPQEAKPADAASDARVEAAIETFRQRVIDEIARQVSGAGFDSLQAARAESKKAGEALRALLRPAPAVSDAEHSSKDDYLGALHRAFDVLCNVARGQSQSPEYLHSVCNQTWAAIAIHRSTMRSRPAASVNAELLAAAKKLRSSLREREALPTSGRETSFDIDSEKRYVAASGHHFDHCVDALDAAITAAESATPPRPAASDEGKQS
jgi:hypothetical protein